MPTPHTKLSLHLLGSFTLLLIMYGCARVPERPVVHNVEQAWQAHRTKLLEVGDWAIKGRIAVRHLQEGWQANLSWQQSATGYQIEITAPLGRGRLRLQGNGGLVTMQTPEGETLMADNPESLMQEYLGWFVPVSGMRHWVLGMPNSGQVDGRQLDGNGQLQQLQQDGWQISYQRYAEVAGLWLPEKVTFENYQLRVRLIIGEWQLDQLQLGGVLQASEVHR